MNRKERRAAAKNLGALPLPALLAEAARSQATGQLNDAIRLYERALELAPSDGETLNGLGSAYLAQGKLTKAASVFTQVIDATPIVLDDVPATMSALASVCPEFPEAMRVAVQTWPTRVSAADAFKGKLVEVGKNPLLLKLMRSVKIRHLDVERLFTGLRRDRLLNNPDGKTPPALLDFYGALAEQCFVTEYIYAVLEDEAAALEKLREKLEQQLTSDQPISEQELLAYAMYASLSTLAKSDALIGRRWSAPVQNVVTQHLIEPAQERELRPPIPALTSIDGGVSKKVQEQYEENPYPRWIKVAMGRSAAPLDRYLKNLFPYAEFPRKERIDMLIAGCGTGRQAIEMASRIDARTLAVDLSRASLAYAMRKTPAAVAADIEYAQADILKLGEIGRSFDAISSAGVLHHMEDPLAAWRILDSLLRPNGYMHLALYSEIARRHIVSARAHIATQGYPSTPEGIRQCRQDIIASPDLFPVTRWGDFYSMSDCRDLLFHVQEKRFTIPMLKDAIAQLGLEFVGFVLHPSEAAARRSKFEQRGWSLTDLDRWNELENNEPNLFASMYQFWVRKR